MPVRRAWVSVAIYAGRPLRMQKVKAFVSLHNKATCISVPCTIRMKTFGKPHTAMNCPRCDAKK